MENSYLPPPFSIIHIIVGHIVDKKQAKRDQSNRHAHDQDNKWFDTVIRSAIIDCLEVCYRPFRGFITMTVERIFCDSREVINYNLKSISDNFTSIFFTIVFYQDYLKIKRQKEGSEVQTLLQNNTRYLKERVQQLQVYMENMNFNMQSGFVELRVSRKLR